MFSLGAGAGLRGGGLGKPTVVGPGRPPPPPRLPAGRPGRSWGGSGRPAPPPPPASLGPSVVLRPARPGLLPDTAPRPPPRSRTPPELRAGSSLGEREGAAPPAGADRDLRRQRPWRGLGASEAGCEASAGACTWWESCSRQGAWGRAGDRPTSHTSKETDVRACVLKIFPLKINHSHCRNFRKQPTYCTFLCNLVGPARPLFLQLPPDT